MSTLLETRQLTLGYPGKTLCTGLSMHISRGASLAVLGANGTGKSTFVKTLLGTLAPLGGQLHWPDGRPAVIGYLAQLAAFDRRFPLRVMDLAAMGAWRGFGLRGALDAQTRDRIAHALAETGIADIAEQPLHTVSGGQLQRALFARVMVQDASLIVLDEPFTAVDQQTEAHLLSIVDRWRAEGRAVVLVVHDLSSALDYCDQALLLGAGKATHGTTDTTLSTENLVAQGYLSARQVRWLSDRLAPGPEVSGV